MEITLDHFLSSKQVCPGMQLQVTLSLPEGELKGTLYEGPLEKLPALKSGGVYAIYEKATGKFYYGSTGNLNIRLLNHLITMRNGEHKNHHFRKFDINSSDFTVKVITVPDREQAFDIEQLLVSKCWGNPKLMNICRDVRTGIGYRHTEEAIAKMSFAAQNRPEMEQVIKDKISTKLKGRTLDPTHAANVSESNKARWEDPEFVARWREKKGIKRASVGDVIYDSVSHIARAYGIGITTAFRRINSTSLQYADWKLIEA
jgi:group I intron endonuclease